MRKLLAASVLLATVIAGACIAFGCGEELPVGGEGDGGAPDATTTPDGQAPLDATGGDADGGAVTDGSAFDGAPCDLVDPPGTFYKTSFDVTCEGWSVVQGEIKPVTDQARCGPGSCRVCVTGPGEALLSRNLPVDIPPGTFELNLQVRGDTFTGALNSNVYLFDDAGAQIAAGQNGSIVTGGNWQSVQAIAGGVSGTTRTVLLRIVTPPDSGTLCYYVDEVRLGHY